MKWFWFFAFWASVFHVRLSNNYFQKKIEEALWLCQNNSKISRFQMTFACHWKCLKLDTCCNFHLVWFGDMIACINCIFMIWGHLHQKAWIWKVLIVHLQTNHLLISCAGSLKLRTIQDCGLEGFWFWGNLHLFLLFHQGCR